MGIGMAYVEKCQFAVNLNSANMPECSNFNFNSCVSPFTSTHTIPNSIVSRHVFLVFNVWATVCGDIIEGYRALRRSEPFNVFTPPRGAYLQISIDLPCFM